MAVEFHRWPVVVVGVAGGAVETVAVVAGVAIIRKSINKQRGREHVPVLIWATQPHRSIVSPDAPFWERAFPIVPPVPRPELNFSVSLMRD